MSRENRVFFLFSLFLFSCFGESFFPIFWVEAQTTLSKLYLELEEKRAKITEGDLEGYYQLANWCREKKLKQREQKIYTAILQIYPDEEKAHKKLGHLLKSGQWYPNEEAWRISEGKIRRLRNWVSQEEKESSWTLWHDHWLTTEESQQLQQGESLLAHEFEDHREVLTQHYHLWSALKSKETLELGRILEQAIRQWKKDSVQITDSTVSEPLKIRILKNHSAFLEMVESDIETFPDYLKKAHGYFDGEACILSYFHDAYRTRQILLHEGRHQYDALVLKIYFALPKWYSEGIAEYYAHHLWEKQKLSMGELNPQENYSLFFVRKWLAQNKIQNVEDFLHHPEQTEVDASWYHNVWALIYYLKNSSYTPGFKAWEQLLYEGKLSDADALYQQFLEKVAADLKIFNQQYKQQLNTWSKLSPKKF